MRDLRGKGSRAALGEDAGANITEYTTHNSSHSLQAKLDFSTASVRAQTFRFHHSLYSVFSSCPPCTIATFLLCPCEMILNAKRSTVTFAAPRSARNCAGPFQSDAKDRQTSNPPSGERTMVMMRVRRSHCV